MGVAGGCGRLAPMCSSPEKLLSRELDKIKGLPGKKRELAARTEEKRKGVIAEKKTEWTQQRKENGMNRRS